MKMRTLLAACVALVMGVVSAAVQPGTVGTDFAAARDYAEKNNVPLVVVWGNTSCDYCNALSDVLETSLELSNWLAKHPILIVEKHEESTSKAEDYLAAKAWIKSIDSKITRYPFVGFYWKKSDGTVVKTAFPGRAGSMPVKTPDGDTAAQFVASLDKYFGDYTGGVTPQPEPQPGESGDATFVTSDSEDDRLEAMSSTEVVYVPLKRETANKAASNVLAVTYPNGERILQDVAWSFGEAQKSVAVAMSVGFSRGRTVALSIRNLAGKELDKSSITLVPEMENLPINPHWIGEYTAQSLPYGEWTMDFDTAKQKVKTYGGKLVAMFGGPLWCPNCEAIENDVFSTKKFKQWAKKNKLVLVHFDQGQASSPSTPEGTPRGRLLTLTQSTKGKSGASYLSRHGIDPYSQDVRAVIDRVTYLTDKWLAPETTAARLANPVVLLLNDDGTEVDARFQRQSEGDTMDLNENMFRLEDLLTLKGDDETKGYRTVTKLELTAGASDAVTYHLNSRKFAYRLTGVKAGEYVRAAVSSPNRNAQDVLVSLLDAGGNTIAEGQNRLITSAPLTAEQAAGLTLMTEAYQAAQSTFFGKATSFAATVSAESGDEELVKTVAFASLTKAEQKTLNPSLFKKLSATVPVYKAVNLGGRRLAGTLAVSVSSSNKVTAKFTGEEALSFSGTWAEIGLMSGTVSTALSAKGGAVLSLTMDAAGDFAAALSDDGEEIGTGEALTGDLSSFGGDYTVTLVDRDREGGTATLTVKVAATGKATVKGTMPDGTAVSVSQVLSLNADGTATLPVYKVAKGGTLSVALAIKPNAAATWGDEGNMDTVREVTGCFATWTADEETEFNVFGGYWKNGATPLAICGLFGLSDELGVVVGGETNDVVLATKSGFRVTKEFLTALAFTKSTGAFAGKAKVVVDGKAVTATVKGVLLPGWIDCGCTSEPVVERPYGSGTLFYKDGGENVSRPIDLVAGATE